VRVSLLAFAIATIVLPSTAGARPRVGGALRLIAARRSATESDGRVPVSVRISGGAKTLARHGIPLNNFGGDLAWGRVTVEELQKIAALPETVAIERPFRLFPSLDRSVAATGAPQARTDLGIDGTGVVVGIVDTGCDFRHADFRAANGTTRLGALLDLGHDRDFRHPELPDYGGPIWLPDEIDAQLAADASGMTAAVPVIEQDVDGHGTHVTGIATSNGLATGANFPSLRYVGMAPGATIVAVEAARDGHSFSEMDVLSGIHFVLDRATALGMPAVVNLSLSADGGPHDGSTNLEQELDALFPQDMPGRALVIAAGNGGSRDLHAGGWVLDGTLDLAVAMPPAAQRSSLDLELWFSDGPPALTIVAPDGTSFGPVAPGGTLSAPPSSSADRVAVDNASSGADPMNARFDSIVQVGGSASTGPAGGTWHVILDGKTTRWDGYLTGVGTATLPRFADHLDLDGRAASPAFATSAISVGSYVTKASWTTFHGMMVDRKSTVGAPSTFSGTGPTADGRFLPDLSAPGEFIASALSRDALPTDDGSTFFVGGETDLLWADDGVHGLLQGTSQAAPHVTGAIALLFQIDATLTPRRVRDLLRASASVDDGAPGFSPRSGFGKLDVARAAHLLAHSPTGTADAARSSVGASRDAIPPGAGTILINVVPRDSTGAPLGRGHVVTIEGHDQHGALAIFAGPVSDEGGGSYQRVLVAHGARGDLLTVDATADFIALDAHPGVWLVDDRSEIGAPYAPAGGCQLGRRAPAGVALLALVCLLLLLRRR
jgi:subtilisin family serine protease